MSCAAITRRLGRIFAADGRSLVVAMDHGNGLDVYPHLADPAVILDAIVAGGADAVLTTPGILKRFAGHFRRLGVILRLDGSNSILASERHPPRLLHSVEDALRLGADAVACMGFPGSPWEMQTTGNLSQLAGDCREWGVPLMAEMIPGSFADSKQHTSENVRLAVRQGFELGADFIKTKYVGPPGAFREITRHACCPVLVLGGERIDQERALLETVRSALDEGASGAVIGRNIWAHPHPAGMVAALAALIHGGAGVSEAMGILASSHADPIAPDPSNRSRTAQAPDGA